jgi:SulP family sulfate permease
MIVSVSSGFRNRLGSLVPDFIGGFTGAVAVLPQTIGLSVLLFTSFGMSASAGAMAGLMGAVILLLFSGIAGATTGMISAPNGPVTILLTGLVARLIHEYSPEEILIVIGAVLFFTGVFEILFGLLRGGDLIKLIPYPVVASMITAIGILMIKSQIKQIIPIISLEDWTTLIPVIVAVSTIGVIFVTGKLFPRLPSILMGLITGIIVYLLIILFGPDPDPEWVIGRLPAMNFHEIFHRFNGIELTSLPWELILSSALALTVLVMIDCLLTALVADSQTSMRHNARKELIAQGTAQMLIGIIGGVGGGGTKGSTLANTMAGGRRWSPVFAALIILMLTFFGKGVGAFLPLSALSGVIIYIGLKMINLNILFWFKDRYTRIDAVNAVLVIAATIFLDVTKAVALGIFFAVITFLRREIKRSLIRRQTNIAEYPSLRKRNERQRKILEENCEKALLMELQGDLFFATSDQIYQNVMSQISKRLVIILHFRRVLSIDMSGMVLLLQLVEVAQKNGTEIVFIHLHKRLGFGKKIKKAFALIGNRKEVPIKIFHSTARALEYAEDVILRSEYKDKDYRISSPKEFEENDLCAGMSENDIELLKKISIRKDYSNKEIVIPMGEKSSSLYLVTSGMVEQRIYNGRVSYKILAKYSPGTYFGKLTFLNPGPISATFVALGNTTVHKIRRSDIEEIAEKGGEGFLTDILFSIGGNLSKESVRLISEIQRLEAL